jgi:hypothetical protein
VRETTETQLTRQPFGERQDPLSTKSACLSLPEISSDVEAEYPWQAVGPGPTLDSKLQMLKGNVASSSCGTCIDHFVEITLSRRKYRLSSDRDRHSRSRKIANRDEAAGRTGSAKVDLPHQVVIGRAERDLDDKSTLGENVEVSVVQQLDALGGNHSRVTCLSQDLEDLQSGPILALRLNKGITHSTDVQRLALLQQLVHYRLPVAVRDPLKAAPESVYVDRL